MFDSPLEHCAACAEMVTLDQTLTECQRKNGCGIDQAWPLQKYFSGVDDSLDPQQEKPSIRRIPAAAAQLAVTPAPAPTMKVTVTRSLPASH